MATVTLDDFKEWLAAYGAAWERGNAHAAAQLFTSDARYYENPFAEPMVGREAIFQYWQEGAGESQREVRFSFQALAVVGDTGLAQWQASFLRLSTGRWVELDGFLLAEFAAGGQCSLFREWWHRRESEGGAASA